jgi:hypothetical protein
MCVCSVYVCACSVCMCVGVNADKERVGIAKTELMSMLEVCALYGVC